MQNLVYFIVLVICFSCARQGSPSGGPRDEDPPVFLKANPDTLSLNVSTDIKEARIYFDEYIVLKDHTKQIVTSPLLGSEVTYSPIGSARKYIQIKFNKPLKSNTTYNFNFGNAIQDNNEGNKLPYFQYVFSTGDYIDSLRIRGEVSVLGQKKMSETILVALYRVDSTYNDSIILKEKPFYVSRVNEEGKFDLNYLHPGKYQIVAFDDHIDNMQFDLGKEKIGFLDEPVDLTEDLQVKIQLANQKPNYKAEKATQKEYGHIVFKATGNSELLEVEPLDMNFKTQRVTYVPKSDSLNFWFNPGVDSIEERSKRIKFLVKNQGEIDTLSMVYSNAQKHNLLLLDAHKGNLTPSKKLKLVANYPLVKIDSSFIFVEKDTVQIPFKIIRDLDSDHAFTIDFNVDFQSKYNVNIAPEALEDFFGKTINDTLKLKFQTQKRNDFGNLKLTLDNKPEKPFWLQLLNKKDEVIDEVYTTDSVFEYTYLRPDEYYFRILVDENENGFWDVADFFTKTQAEKAYVYPQTFNVRAMWDLDENWVLPSEDEVELELDEVIEITVPD